MNNQPERIVEVQPQNPPLSPVDKIIDSGGVPVSIILALCVFTSVLLKKQQNRK